MGIDKRRLALVQNPGQGTGYVISPRLVLTAGHVVDLDVIPEVGLIGSSATYTAEILWRRKDETLDAALLQIVDTNWPATVPKGPIRWGRLSTLRPGTAWTALAFPVGYRDAMDQIDIAQLDGQLNPGDKLLSRRYLVKISGGAPTVGGNSPWAGASGAAFFIGDLLCGILIVDPTEWNHNSLEAVPASLLFEDDEFRKALGFQPPLEAVELQPIATPPRIRSLSSVADLLHPDTALMPFHGPAEKETLPSITDWCTKDDQLGVGLLYGSAGRGKTRLAAELSSALRLTKWTVIYLRRPEHVASVQDYSTIGDVTTPVLIIVDYAESRIEQVKALLEFAGKPEHMRLLLLARSAGEWWEDLRGQLASRTIAWHMPVLAENPEDWVEEYHTALHYLVQGLAELDRDVDWTTASKHVAQPAQILPDGVPLTIQMAALVNLLDYAAPTNSPKSEPLEGKVLAHEGRYWAESAKAFSMLSAFPMPVLKLLVATTVLVLPSSKSEARQVLSSVPGLGGEYNEAVRISAADWLHALYPASDSSYWGALQPDLLGEYHLGVTMRAEPDFLTRIVPALDKTGIEHAITVLARVAVHEAHHQLVMEHLRQLFAVDPLRIAATAVAVAVRTENPSYVIEPLEAYVNSSDATPESIAAISSEVPFHTHTLEAFAASVSARRVEVLKQQLGLPADIAHVSRRQVRSNAGRYRDLVDALNDYSVRLAGMGFETQALEHTKLAQEIGRHLPLSSSNLLTLANVFSNRANQLQNVGRIKESIKTGRTAIALYRLLVPRDPVEAAPGLARALSNQASRLDKFGKRKQALAAVSESIEIHRKLAKIAEVFEPDLARALGTQFARLFMQGHDDAALAAILESEAIFRKLVERYPNSYLRPLVDTLNNKAIGLKRLGRLEEALTTIDEGINIHKSILEGYPDYYAVGYARAWQTKALILFESGRRDETISALKVSVDLYQSLIERSPQEIVADFMEGLTNAGYILKDFELYEDSRWYVEEALIAYIVVARENVSAAMVILRMGELLLFHHKRDPGGGRVWVEKNRRGEFTFKV